jgi:hypothetical protein
MGLADAWILETAASAADTASGSDEYGGSTRSIDTSSEIVWASLPSVSLYSLVLVNLPVASRVNGSMNLLSLALHSFGLARYVPSYLRTVGLGMSLWALYCL